MENNKINYIQGINDIYFNKANTLQNRLDDYNNLVNTIKAEREDAKFKKQQLAQQLALEKQQMAWEREKFYQQLNSLNNYTDYADAQTSQQTNNTGNKTSTISQLLNTVKQTVIDAAKNEQNKKYKPNVNPALSGATASKWFQQNIFDKEFTKTELKNLLQKAYDNKQIKANDVKQILWACGLE